MSTQSKTWIRRSVGGVVALLGVAFILDCLVGPNFHVVRAGVLYRSAQPTASDLKTYRDRDGVRSVVNLRGVWENEHWFEAEKQAAEKLGLTHFDVDFYTHRLAPLPELRKFVAALDGCGKPALIHCRRGADRTSLAAAIYRLLYEERSLDEAMAEYRLAYLHTGWAVGSHLPHLFDCYRDWLKLKSREHTADAFRTWLAEERVIGCFGAAIEPEGPAPRAVVGQPLSLRLKATNISRYPWRLATRPAAGIHLVVRNLEPQTPEKIRVVAAAAAGETPPGGSVVFEAVVPARLQPGRLALYAYMQDSDGIRFDRMGEGCWKAYVEIADKR